LTAEPAIGFADRAVFATAGASKYHVQGGGARPLRAVRIERMAIRGNIPAASAGRGQRPMADEIDTLIWTKLEENISLCMVKLRA